MHKLLELLRIDQEVITDEENFQKTSDSSTSLNHLFSSILGVSFVSKCLQQISEVRFGFFRFKEKKVFFNSFFVLF